MSAIRGGSLLAAVAAIAICIAVSFVNATSNNILAGQVLAGTTPIKHATVTLFGTVGTCVPDPCFSTSMAVEETTTDAEGRFSFDLSQAHAKVQRMPVSPETSFVTVEQAPASGSLYLVATGGDAGKGNNPATKLISAFGSAPPEGHVVVNELTTVIAAFSLHGITLSAGRPGEESLLLTLQLVDPVTGTLRRIFNRGRNSPALVNTLADIMHGCVISTGLKSHECESLFQAMILPRWFQKPDNTLLAIESIVSTEGRGQTSDFALLLKERPYGPVLERPPAGWLLSLNFDNLGLHRPTEILADLGDHTVWVMSQASHSLAELSTNPGDLTAPLMGESELPAAVRNGAIAFWFQTPLFDYPSKARPKPSGWFSQPSAWLVDDKLTFLKSDGTLCGTASSSIGLKDAEGLSSCVDFSAGRLCGTALNPEGLPNCENFGDALCIANAGDDKIVVVKAPTSARCDDAKMLKTLDNVKGETPDLRLAEPTHLVRCIQNNSENWITNRASNSVTAFHVFDNKVTIVPGSPFHGGGLADPEAIACDLGGRVWIANHARNSNSVTQLEESSDGRGTTELRTMSPESGFSGVGMNRPYGVAVDQQGNVWVSNEGNDSLTVLIGAGQ
jgi:hypothetical protein